MAEDDEAPVAEEKERRLSTKSRLLIAVSAVAVVAVTLGVIGKLIESDGTDHLSYGSPVSRVELRLDDGHLRLAASNGSSTEVDVNTTYMVRKPKVTKKVNGNTLQLTAKCPRIKFGRCKIQMNLAVPENVAIVAHLANGNADATNIKGALDIKTDNGRITTIGTSGELKLKSDDGQIVAKQTNSLRSVVSTSNGKIDLQYVVAPHLVDARSANGSVIVTIPKAHPPFNVRATSGNGKSTVNVKTDPASANLIEAHSENGNVTVQRAG